MIGVTALIDLREHTCCFTGHRKIPNERVNHLYEAVRLEMSWLISHGIVEFYTGGALGFDTIAALAVLDARNRNPGLKLNLALPYPEQAQSWKAQERETYDYILSAADNICYSSEHYHGGVMHLRNRYMVEHSSICVCYYDKSLDNGSNRRGGTLYTVNYARQLGLKLLNLGDEPPYDSQLEFDFR